MVSEGPTAPTHVGRFGRPYPLEKGAEYSDRPGPAVKRGVTNDRKDGADDRSKSGYKPPPA